MNSLRVEQTTKNYYGKQGPTRVYDGNFPLNGYFPTNILIY